MMGYDPYGGYGYFASSVNNNFMNPPPPFIELPPPPPVAPQPYIAPPPPYIAPPLPPPYIAPPLPPPYIAPPLPPPYIAPPLPPYTSAGMYDASYWGLHSNPTSIPVVDYYGGYNSEADYSMWARNLYADSVKTAVDTAKPYDPSYASPPFEKIGSLDDSTNDFSSTCLSSSGGTSHSANKKKVSGWSGLNQLDSSWNGLNDTESGHNTDSNWDFSFSSKEKNAAGSPLRMDYVKSGIPDSGATEYDEVKQSSEPLSWKPLTIGTTYSPLNMDLSHQNDEFSCKSESGVDYPHLTLNSNKFEVGDKSYRCGLYPKSISRDDAVSHSTNKSLSKSSEPHLARTDNPDRYSFNLNEIKFKESVDNSSKSFDPYNPTEDSPCWKGASSSRFSLFGGSDASTQPLPEKSSYVRDVSQELGESFTSNPSKAMDNILSPTMKKASFSTYSNEGHSDNLNSTKPGAFVPEQHCNWVFASPINPPLEDASLTSEKCATRSYLVEKDKNVNESYGKGSLHVTTHKAHVKSNFSNLYGEESTPKIDLAAMIKTMHDLSDLLLFHCSNNECTLKEQEHAALKHAISNINSCMSTTPPSTLKRKSEFSADLYQDANVTDIAAANVIDNVGDHVAHDKRSPNMLPRTEDEECHDFGNVHNVSDFEKPDEMTQAIKKVLSEKFKGEEENLPQALLYKNLWLEAEAVICSTNFKARFDRVKNEMEKSSPLKVQVVDNGLQDMIDMEKEKSSPSEVYPDEKLVNDLKGDMTSSIKNSPMISKSSPTDDVMARFRILKSRDTKSTSMSPTDIVKDVSSCASDADISIQDIPVRSQINHVDDVLARFDILTSRGDSSISMNTPETIMPPIFGMFPALEDLNTHPRDTCVQGSPLSSKTCGSNDADDAVMARLHILKCRADVKNETVDTGISSDLQNHVDENKLNLNKTDLDMSFQSCDEEEAVEKQHSAGWYDGPSLDWEHVLKDDFVWQK